MSSAWIFSSNPEKYDLLAEIEAREVRPGAEGRWQANQRRQDMHPGDVVYHWVTGAQSGIYAVSRIIGEPHEAQVPKWPDHHWWIDLRFEQVLSRPVLKADLEAHPLLRGLNILHMPRMTNYLLTPEQAEALQRLVRTGATPMMIDKAQLQQWISYFWAAWEMDREKVTDRESLQAHAADHHRRVERAQQLLTPTRIPVLAESELRELLKDTDALGFWKDQDRRLNKILSNRGIESIRTGLADLVTAAERGLVLEDFRRAIESTPGLGVLAISELLTYRFPDRYWIYSSKVTLLAFQKLGLDVKATLPHGQKNDDHIYLALQEPMGQVVDALRRAGFDEADYHFADMFLWFVKERPQLPPPPPPPPPLRPISSLSVYLSAHNFHFSPDLLATYYLSLQTKPFVILSGLSGTGKTKLAQYFAEWMGAGERAILIPVHPDWTDHRGLLGFCHLLTGTYHATDFLRLLLAARVDWMHREKRPYFVVLDEMNLARVEHYFADFLSVLESRRQGEDGVVYQDPLSLHDQPRCLLAAGNEALAQDFYAADADHKTCAVACEGCPFQDLVKEEHRRGEYTYDEARRGHFDPLYFVPPRLEVPLNVYFTGTVNVDETTFTFSPKVLDRANVIEFGEVDLEGYWEEMGQGGQSDDLSHAEDVTVRAFTHEFTYPFTTGLREETLQEPDLAPYREQLAALVHLLEPSHMHFGYRVADEILVYLLNARHLDDPAFNLDAAFDCAMLQKILPRFHGSRARLWQPLLHLLAFCTGDPSAVTEQAKAWGEMSVERIREQAGPEPRLPRSTAKLLRMLSDLETEGFTSFT